MNTSLRAPFPYFGGKSKVGHLCWARFGADVPNYVEPFAGSLAVMLSRPGAPRIETVNDIDCYLSNFWRAVKHAPAEVARWADWPVNEADLHARHTWLVNQAEFRERMKTDPDYFCPKIAGWWVWGICSWIGSGFCALPEWAGRINAVISPRGVNTVLGIRNARTAGQNVWRKRPSLRRGGKGVVRQVPDISGLDGAAGRRIHASGKPVDGLVSWMEALADRLRRVRVCCGDWKRVLGRSPTECIGTTAILLDPPYGERASRDTCYTHDDFTIAGEVREWALSKGDHPKYRIALCGYEGEHKMPPSWECVAWKANGGYGNTGKGRGRENAARERIWFSPHCLKPYAEPQLFTPETVNA